MNSMSKTVVIDLDGVIVDFNNCENRGVCDYSKYPEEINLDRSKCPVNKMAKSYLNMIKSMDLRIIILTSRVYRERPATIRWLRKHEIPYDEIQFNKPRGFIYCDDLGYKFENWEDTLKEIERRVTV